MCWFLYLVRTADNALYTGITTDVPRRFLQHQTGKGAKALRGKGELTLAFSAVAGDRSLALRLEYRIKQLTKRQKERLVSGDGRLRRYARACKGRRLKAIEAIVVFHQAAHAVKRIVGQTVDLESRLGARPAATQIVMCRFLEA